MSNAEPDSSLKVYCPTRRIRFFLLTGVVLAFGVFLLLIGAAALSERPDGFWGNDGRAGFAGIAWTAFGLVCLALALPPLLRSRRICTAVYRDRVVISTALRTRVVPFADVRRVFRSPHWEGEGRDPIYLETLNGEYHEDVAIQFVDDAEQDEFMALVNRLIADHPSR